MSETPTLITADELLHMPHDNKRLELVEGVVRVMEPAGAGHGRVAARICRLLGAHADSHGLGETFGAETGFLIARDPDTVRAPDAAFVRRERFEAIGPTDKFWPEAPDLAVEVVSPDDSFRELQAKALMWLDAGSRLVLVADPRRRTITSYRSRDDIHVHEPGTVIDAGDVLAGWSLVVDEAFG